MGFCNPPQKFVYFKKYPPIQQPSHLQQCSLLPFSLTIFTSSIFEKLRTKMFTLTVVGSSENNWFKEMDYREWYCYWSNNAAFNVISFVIFPLCYVSYLIFLGSIHMFLLFCWYQFYWNNVFPNQFYWFPRDGSLRRISRLPSRYPRFFSPPPWKSININQELRLVPLTFGHI